MVDPRASVIGERLSHIRRIVAVGDNPTQLCGVDVSNALIELLAITQWGALDFFIIDMPPGMGSEVEAAIGDHTKLLDAAAVKTIARIIEANFEVQW